MSAGAGSSAETGVFRFVGYTLDLTRGRLWGPSGDIRLRPKPFALLGYMVQHAGRVLPKDELLDALWPDVTVTEDSLSQCVHALRDGLGPSGSSLVRTVPRRGYLFDLPKGAEARPDAETREIPVGNPDQSSSRNSSLAVMPFATGPQIAPEDRMWFDGVVNDVISQLARLRSFDVIARGSTFALRDLAVDPAGAGKRLGADYVLSGLVAPQGRGYRLGIELVRADTGTILWTDEIGMERDSFLPLVRDLVDRIVASVLRETSIFERDRARQVPDQSLTAWQAYHRGLEAFTVYTEPMMLKARAYFERAIERDPTFVRAYAALSECHATVSRAQFCRDAKAEARAARRMADVAMRLDEASPFAQFAYAHVRWLHGDVQDAMVHAQQSVVLGPSFATGFAEIGFYESLYGDPDRALRNLDRSEVLNPFSPFLDSVHADRSIACLQKGDFEAAAKWATAAISRHDSYPQMQITGAIILAASEAMDEARAVLDRLRDERAVFEPRKMLRPPVSLRGPARDRMLRAMADLGV